eukprot:g3990.t1
MHLLGRARSALHYRLWGHRSLSAPAPAYASALEHVHEPPVLDASTGILHRDRALDEEFYTLPAEAYTSPAIFNEEQARIFSKSWTYLDHASNLPAPGCFTTANIAGEEILLVRGRGETKGEPGGIRAFFNVCPHRAHRLVQPGSQGRRPVVLCPNHAWSFRLDGSLLKARRAEGGGPCFDAERFSLKEVRVENFGGLLFGNLDPDAPSLFESLQAPGLAEEMDDNLSLSKCQWQCEATVEKEVKANWKALVDNFLECYHCDTAHKDFVDMVDMSRYESDIFSHHVYNYSPCKPDNKAYSFSEDDPNKAIHYYWMWPNTVVYTSPGPYNISVLQFIPLTESTSLRRAHRFFEAPSTYGDDGHSNDDDGSGKKREGEGDHEDDEQTRKRDAAVQYLNEVLLEEDTALCESIQTGLASKGYSQGRFVIDPEDGWATERAVAQFHGLVHQAMA